LSASRRSTPWKFTVIALCAHIFYINIQNRLWGTKPEALVKNVFEPQSLQLILKNIRSGPFSVACDMSNKGKLKLYPVAIPYFKLERAAILD
jgi:hypothetical protein